MLCFVQNAARLMRGLFEIALHRGWPTMAYRLLGLCKMLDKRLWGIQNPLHQFPILNRETLVKLEDKKATIHRLRDMPAGEIGMVVLAVFLFSFRGLRTTMRSSTKDR